MGTFLLLYTVGAAISGVAYVVWIAREFAEHSRVSGIWFEIVHFGVRAWVICILWPVFVIALVAHLLTRWRSGRRGEREE